MNKIIQVAGIIDTEEAKMLMGMGVEYLGFPLRLPVNREDLTEEEAIDVIRQIKQPHKPVLITYLDKAKDIIDFCDKLNVRIVQLHGKIEKDQLRLIKDSRPDIEIFKSLVVHGDNLNELKKTVNSLSDWVDIFITDSFNPQTGASGATGMTHDWTISRTLIELSPKPVILAGGLNPQNVREAILMTKPAGVDVHTGIEGADGRKDPILTKKFIDECTEGFGSV